jgi:hypothetical protein
VQLPDDAVGLPSEYEALTARLQPYYDGKLSALKETPQQQDITYLATALDGMGALSRCAQDLVRPGVSRGAHPGSVY